MILAKRPRSDAYASLGELVWDFKSLARDLWELVKLETNPCKFRCCKAKFRGPERASKLGTWQLGTQIHKTTLGNWRKSWRWWLEMHASAFYDQWRETFETFGDLGKILTSLQFTNLIFLACVFISWRLSRVFTRFLDHFLGKNSGNLAKWMRKEERNLEKKSWKEKEKGRKPTASSVPRRSPIQVLTGLNVA